VLLAHEEGGVGRLRVFGKGERERNLRFTAIRPAPAALEVEGLEAANPCRLREPT
jgi:hypothetical protein